MTPNGSTKNSTNNRTAGAISQAMGDGRCAATVMRARIVAQLDASVHAEGHRVRGMLPERPMASKLPLLVLLIAVTCLSQFYRVSNSVIAPELTRDLHLSARQIGWAGSAFFFALFAVQLPIGLLFDRYGARRTVSAVSLLAVVGAVWIAHATDAADLIAGRIIVGVGCAASFMSVVFLCARWFSARELSTTLSWVFAASNLGTLAGATPLAWVAAEIGWGHGFPRPAGNTALGVGPVY